MSEPAANPVPPPDPLAVALAKLDPAPHGFDRDALMFAAGRASKLNALTFWKAVAAVMALAAATFATLYATRQPEVRVIERPAVLAPQR